MYRSALIVPEVVRQHVEEAANLFATRTALTDAPHVGLPELQRLDERLAAHLDGLSVAGDHAWPFCESALELPCADTVFTAAVWALENAPRMLDQLFTVARADRTAVDGLAAAFEWVEPVRLQGIVSGLLSARDPVKREAGVAACGAHRVDPGSAFAGLLKDSEAAVRARALRAVGEVGRTDLLSFCLWAMNDADADSRFWAACSAALLGDRHRAVEYLTSAASTGSPHGPRAFRLALQILGVGAGHEVLRAMAGDPRELERVIEGSGIVGDVTYVPWLLGHMGGDDTCRLAGEAFSLVTGVDLARTECSRPAPASADARPDDDSDEGSVGIDRDEGLPWPDPERVQRWWDAHALRFQPGTRAFMGAPVTREHCQGLLTTGYQRQRILAAQYLCLLEPGTPLFNTSAPAWRQRRLLAEMT